MKNAKIKLKELHDLIKEHPFWYNFDEKFLNDLTKLYSDVLCNVYEGLEMSERKNPYAVLLSALHHDFSCMLGFLKRNGPSKVNKDYIMVLQTYLQNLHRALEWDASTSSNEPVIGFNLKGGYGEALKFKVIHLNEKLKAVNCITDRDLLKKYIAHNKDRYAGHSFYKDTYKWYTKCEEEIEKGKNIIGETWLIEN